MAAIEMVKNREDLRSRFRQLMLELERSIPAEVRRRFPHEPSGVAIQAAACGRLFLMPPETFDYSQSLTDLWQIASTISTIQEMTRLCEFLNLVIKDEPRGSAAGAQFIAAAMSIGFLLGASTAGEERARHLDDLERWYTTTARNGGRDRRL